MPCDLKRHHYAIIEENVLHDWLGIDVNDLLPDSTANLSALGLKRNRAQEIAGELTAIQEMVEGWENKMKKGISKLFEKSLTHRIEASLLEIEKLKKELTAIQEDIRVSEIAPKDTEAQIKNIQELFQKMKELKDEELLSLRLNLRGQLKRLIKEIRIHNQAIGIIFESGRIRSIDLSGTRLVKVRDRTR